MKSIVFICSFLLSSVIVSAQNVMRMEDGVSASFLLDHTWLLKFDKVNYQNPSLKEKGDYYAKLSFGKNRFDIVYYRSSDRSVVGGRYPIFQTSEYFKLTEKKEYSEEYKLTRNVGSKMEMYIVSLNNLSGGIIASVFESTDSGKKWIPVYIGNGKF